MRHWKWEIDNNTFDLINLDFFLNYRFMTIISYISVYVFLLLKIAFLASDIYTLIKLIVFNTWTSDIQPFISYAICRWLFFACILLSVIFYLWAIIRSIIAYRTRNVSLTYINPGASFMYSVKSYKCFCVYNEISSDNFFNYLTFFTYFTFQNCLILLLCDTPRQVINGITIFKILKFNSSMIQVIKEIASKNENEAIILSFMTFSFIIWFIFFVKFLFACLLFCPIYYKIKYEYKYEYGLKQYCCIKINNCIQKFMKVKHSKSLEEIKKQNNDIHPKLPDFAINDSDDDEEKQLPQLPMLSHKDSESTLVDPRVRLKNSFASANDLRNPFADQRINNEVSRGRFINQRQGSDISLPYAPLIIPRKDSNSSLLTSTTRYTRPQRTEPIQKPQLPYMNNKSQNSSILSLPDFNEPINRDRENLISHDQLASKKTLIEELELPPRFCSTENLEYERQDSQQKELLDITESELPNDDDDVSFEGLRRFNLSSHNETDNSSAKSWERRRRPPSF